MSLGSRLVVARAESSTRRSARRRREQLRREIAGYSSPAERLDLEATLDRYPDGVTHEIREILVQEAWLRDRDDRNPG